MDRCSLNFKPAAAHLATILFLGIFFPAQAHAGEGLLSDNHKNALKFCSLYTQVTFLRALERKHFESSAQHHAAIQKDNPGEGTAKMIHETIEIVWQFPQQKPHELTIIGYARCMGKFVDSFWDYEKEKVQQ